jgi:putative component of toxin-antitoxin plasmid stabilization module
VHHLGAQHLGHGQPGEQQLLEGPVWELRIRLRDVAARVTYWCTPGRRIVLLTVFHKTKQHDQRQIDRAVRAQKVCERDHHGSVTETFERQV